jgi:hypothetical protein
MYGTSFGSQTHLGQLQKTMVASPFAGKLLGAAQNRLLRAVSGVPLPSPPSNIKKF